MDTIKFEFYFLFTWEETHLKKKKTLLQHRSTYFWRSGVSIDCMAAPSGTGKNNNKKKIRNSLMYLHLLKHKYIPPTKKIKK